MGYTFATHVPQLASLCPQAGPDSPAGSVTCVALIDAAQQPGLGERLQRLLPGLPFRPLFLGCFAEAALEVSPVLVALSSEPAELAEQMARLDKTCNQWPILSFVFTPLDLEALVVHLQSLLRVEADGDKYLLRLADSQMLAAAVAASSPAQRALLFRDIEAWWTVDHRGQLSDATACEKTPAAEAPPSLEFDTAQTHAMLRAAALPMLAAQLRNTYATFAQRFSHAEQIAFIENYLQESGKEGMDGDEVELISSLTLCWEEMEKALESVSGKSMPPRSSSAH